MRLSLCLIILFITMSILAAQVHMDWGFPTGESRPVCGHQIFVETELDPKTQLTRVNGVAAKAEKLSAGTSGVVRLTTE